MSKQRKLIAGIIAVGIVANSIGATSYADEFQNTKLNTTESLDTLNGLSIDEVMSIPGLVSIVTEFGVNEKPSVVVKGYLGSDFYGYGLLNKDRVVEFIKWLTEQNSKYSQIFDTETVADIVNTEEFNNLWSKASELDAYDFALKQQTYIMETQIKPVIEYLESETGVAISGHKGLEELIHNKTISYGDSTAIRFIKEALLEDSNAKSIDFNKVIDKVNQLETEFTNTEYSTHERVKAAKLKSINKEAEYLKEIHAFSLKYGGEKETEKESEEITTSLNEDIDAVKTSIEKKDNSKLKNSLLNLILKIFNF